MVLRLQAQPSRIALSGMMILGFAFLSWAALRPWVAQRAFKEGPLDSAARRALAIEPHNGRFHAALGAISQYSLLLRDYPVALASYQAALQLNPLDGSSWLHLGKLYATIGQAREADQAFRLATQFGQSDAPILWEIAVAYLDEGQVQEAVAVLIRFLFVSPPNDIAKGYEMVRRLVSADEVLDKMIGPDVSHYTHYANYLLDRNLGDQALAAWNRLSEMASRTGEPIDPHLQLRVVDLLMGTGKPGLAYPLWTHVTKQIEPDAAPTESNLVSNGSFEHKETVGRGFDWRIGGAPGVTWAFDPATAYTGRRSLRLSFTKSRADFSNVSQSIPVQPNSSYALMAYIRTDLPVRDTCLPRCGEGTAQTGGLAGSPGINFEVVDPAQGVLARTDTVGGTRDWTKLGLRFRTSGNSQSVTLRIHSEPPPAWMPPVSGSAWIDNVMLTKVQ